MPQRRPSHTPDSPDPGNKHPNKDVNAAVLQEITSFIMEAGTGFAFVARHKRMTIEKAHHSLDLLFYQRKIRRLVAIQLILGERDESHNDWMARCLAWLNLHEREEAEAPPIGLILCLAKKSGTMKWLEMETGGVRVSSSRPEVLPHKALLEKLHEAAERGRTSTPAAPEHTGPQSAAKLPASKPVKTAGPTRQQGQFLSFIAEYIKRNHSGVAPTHSALQKYFNLSAPSVNSMLQRLEQRGFIRRFPGLARGIELTTPAHMLPKLERPFKF